MTSRRETRSQSRKNNDVKEDLKEMKNTEKIIGETSESIGNREHQGNEEFRVLRKRSAKSTSSLHKSKKLKLVKKCSLDVLNSDSLEHISCFLDTNSALALYRTSKTIHNKLVTCTRFWKSLCENENFQDHAALKTDEDEDSVPRLAWSGEILHDVEVPKDAVFWRKIFIRGIQMRRNICSGKYELWRLFMTDEENLPVKLMKPETTFRELRTSHRRSPFNIPNRRRAGIDYDWNKDFLITIRSGRSFHDIFVWSWNESQNPKFLYSFNMFPLYPSGLFPTAFFVHKNYLVFMPEVSFIPGVTRTRSMIRVHDLRQHMALVGSYDFPLDGYRRHIGWDFGAAHLREVGGKAVALCNTPKFMFFVFSVPSCELVHQVCLLQDLERPLELDMLAQNINKMGTTLMFEFQDPDFYDHLHGDQQFQKKYGRLLVVDFEQFFETKQPIDQRIDNTFDCNEDFVEASSLIGKDKLVCVLMSGKIVVRKMIVTSDISVSFEEHLSIPCPEPLQPEGIDKDFPALCTSSTGDLILTMRHFLSGRKLHAYSSAGTPRYVIDVDAPGVGLARKAGNISIHMDASFVCAADRGKVVIWDNNTGSRLNTIQIPKHYNSRDDSEERQEMGMWVGLKAFVFKEDWITIIHNHRNFPAAADVIRFWRKHHFSLNIAVLNCKICCIVLVFLY